MCTSNEKPLFKFGLVADVQYGDFDDQWDFTKEHLRHYRQSLVGLGQTVSRWNEEEVDFALQLGDIIDGLNSEKGLSEAALDTVFNQLKDFDKPFHHTFGNHDLYNFKRSHLLSSRLNSAPISDKSKSYYSFSPYPGFLIIMLDTYSTSMLGLESTDKAYKEAHELLKTKNPNDNLNSPNGLSKHNKRYCKFNGAIDLQQMTWLNDTLQRADQRGMHVIVAGMCIPGVYTQYMSRSRLICLL